MAAASSSVARCLLRSHPRENLTRWTTGRLLRHCISIACSWFFRFVARSRCRWEHTHTHQCRLHLRSPSIQLTELWNFVGCGAPWPASTRSQTGAFIGRWPPIFRFWLIQTACSVGIWCGSLFTPPPSFAFIRRAAKILCFLFALHFAALWLVAVYCPPELSIKRQHNFFSTQANYGKEENQWDIVVLCSADDKKSKSVNLVEATNDQIGSGKPVRQ